MQLMVLADVLQGQGAESSNADTTDVNNSAPSTSTTPPDTTASPPPTRGPTARATRDRDSQGKGKSLKSAPASPTEEADDPEVLQAKIDSLIAEMEALKKRHANEMSEQAREIEVRVASAREEGLLRGKEEGVKEDHAISLWEGYQSGLVEGKDKGFEKGKDEGLEEGEREGKRQGELSGRLLGRTEGLNMGRHQGLHLCQYQFLRSARGQAFLEKFSEDVNQAYPQSKRHYECLIGPCQQHFIYGFQIALKQAFSQGFRGRGDMKTAWENTPPLTGWLEDEMIPNNDTWKTRALQEIISAFEQGRLTEEDLAPVADPSIPPIHPITEPDGEEKDFPYPARKVI